MKTNYYIIQTTTAGWNNLRQFPFKYTWIGEFDLIRFQDAILEAGAEDIYKNTGRSIDTKHIKPVMISLVHSE